MASRALGLRRRLILREQNDLHVLDERIDDAKRARDDAVHAFELARAAMDATSKEVAILCSRREVAKAQLDEICLSYRRDFVASLPLDVLSCIFYEVVALPESFLTCSQYVGCYSLDHALAPFSLAAVCSRWRALALEQPRLWTYISVPDEMEEQEAQIQHQRIQLLLRLSKTNSLDIYICWTQSAQNWEGCPSLEKILSLVFVHAMRWRTLELRLPNGVGRRDHITVFKGPLPLLEILRFHSTEETPEDNANAKFLPFAPKLREIIIHGPNGLHLSSTSGLCSVRILRSWDQFSPGQMCSLLPAVSQNLESLALGFFGNEIMPPPSVDLVLPRLTSLTIDTSDDGIFSYLARVRMPALQRIALPGNAILPQAAPFFDRISASVHTLVLGERLFPSHVEQLQHLNAIRVLLFDDENYAGEPSFVYEVADEFFAAVSRDVWPKLSSVRLLSCAGTFIIGEGAATLSFISSRTQELDGTEGAPCRLQDFEVGTGAPGWFLAEAKRLLDA